MTPGVPVGARLAAGASIALLLADLVVWHLRRFSPGTATLVIALAALPWLLCAPGLWRGDRRRYAWATLATAPYLGYGLMEVLANPGARAYAALLVFLAFAVFVALLAGLRLSRPRGPAPT